MNVGHENNDHNDLDSLDNSIEELKTHKIQAKPKRKRLNLLGQLDVSNVPDIDEAFGGRGEAATNIDDEMLHSQVIDVLKSIYDPEIPVNIYDLGLIYEVNVVSGEVTVNMTLTAPACPVAGAIVQDVATRVGALDGVRQSHVKLVWDPPWERSRMSEDALLELGLL